MPVTVPTAPARYLRDDFLRSFINEASPSNWDPAEDKGVFAITLLCLTYWDAAAGLENGTGEADTLQTIEFMRTRLTSAPSPFGQRYCARSALLVGLFRHGLVHQRFPGELACTAGTVSWVLDRVHKHDDEDHLRLVGPMAPTDQPRKAFGITLSPPVLRRPPYVSGNVPQFRIALKPDLLFEHSRIAFEHLASECETNRGLSQRVGEGIREAKLPRKVRGQEVARMVEAALAAPDPWR